MKTGNVRYLTEAAVIAAVYIVLTYLAWGFDLASGAIQCRISEALTVLPYYTSAAVPGLSIGCVLANFLTGAPLPDVIFGSLATLIGACGSYLLRKNRYLVSIPPVIANALIIPLVLRFAYGIPDGIPFLMLTVGAGEVIACMVFGQLLITALMPVRRALFETV
ncbi:MAG: QueT transporter family protein [Lachnospiraceae bacterium]|nr:QueT transporter family protein [Lachnospiraceae bacterium]